VSARKLEKKTGDATLAAAKIRRLAKRWRVAETRAPASQGPFLSLVPRRSSSLEISHRMVFRLSFGPTIVNPEQTENPTRGKSLSLF
jgi:hypothetical protein